MGTLYYLASPYNHESEQKIQERYEANVRARAGLHSVGQNCFSPIVHNHAVARICGSGWAMWKEFDEEMLRRCDGLLVLRLEGWQESVGVQGEIKLAQEMGMPISYIDAD